MQSTQKLKNLHYIIIAQSNIYFKIEMRITKRPSLRKDSKDSAQKEKPMNMTMASAMYSHKQLKQPKLPPLRAKQSLKRHPSKAPKQESHKQMPTESTLVESQMLQSCYQSIGKQWIKPSEYIRDISELNLIGEQGLEVEKYQIRLNEKMEKNMGKLDLLVGLIEKWVAVLRKILALAVSKKSNTPYLIEEVKFWRALSKKFDELEYEFNSEKVQQLVGLAKAAVKTRPELKITFQQFLKLKQNIVEKTPLLRKLYLSLQQSVSGNIQRFIQSSDIVLSTQFLKRTLLAYQMISQNNPISRHRMNIVYDKMNDAMIGKLTAATLYPRQLANISSIKQKYYVLDKASSFYSNFISIIEQKTQQQQQDQQLTQILDRAEYTRNVLVNLLQVMGYFEYLYRKKQVLQFSKLFSVQFGENIFDYGTRDQWMEYMGKVGDSMEGKGYEV